MLFWPSGFSVVLLVVSSFSVVLFFLFLLFVLGRFYASFCCSSITSFILSFCSSVSSFSLF